MLFETRQTAASIAEAGIGLWGGRMSNAAFFVGPYLALVDFRVADRLIGELDAKSFAKLFNVTSSSLSEGVAQALLSKGACKGVICHTDKGEYEQISYVAAEKGFGPALYYAVTNLSDTGFIGSDKDVTPAAEKVWQRFYSDTAVHRQARPEKNFQSEPLKYIYAPEPESSAPMLQEAQLGKERFAAAIKGKAEQLQFDEMDMKILEHWLNKGLDACIAQCCAMFFEEKYS